MNTKPQKIVATMGKAYTSDLIMWMPLFIGLFPDFK